MSDLISRSELIENFRKCYSGHLGMENSDACMTFHGICNVINNTNTVYDVDKVITELEQHYDDDSVICGLGYNEAIKKAIEIIKQCGASDDVCEWELDGDNLITGCGDYFNTYDNCTDKFKYCPRCGKKIKVEE